MHGMESFTIIGAGSSKPLHGIHACRRFSTSEKFKIVVIIIIISSI